MTKAQVTDAILDTKRIMKELEEETNDRDWYYPYKRTEREYLIRRALQAARELDWRLSDLE